MMQIVLPEPQQGCFLTTNTSRPLPCSYESWSVCASTPTPTRDLTLDMCTRLPNRCTCGLQAPERGCGVPVRASTTLPYLGLLSKAATW